MIKRDLEAELLVSARSFPVIAVVGPRQSGKTTLVREVFPDHRYVTLEDFYVAERARQDPKGFLKDFPSKSGIIIDEIQNVPELLSYMQGIVDEEKKKGFFVITGSQNILVNQAITQSLAGRVAYITLFPLSIHELAQADLLPKRVEELIFSGSYPGVAVDSIDPEKFYKNLISTYVEKDVRQIKQITNFTVFQRFLTLCASRVGQVLSTTQLASDADIDFKTAQAWISVLEATYTIFLLYPYHKNITRRVIPSPKLYFVDTGLACSLLRLRSTEELLEHSARGPLFENLVITDLFKQYYNLDLRPSLYFWHDQGVNEIDCIIERALQAIPLEIKAGKTPSGAYFKPLHFWRKKIEQPVRGYVVYAGDEDLPGELDSVVSWKSAGNLVTTIEGKKTTVVKPVKKKAAAKTRKKKTK